MIEVSNLSHQVPVGEETLSLLQDVSLHLEKAQSAAIIGRSGSGKTTLLGLMAGLDLPSHGAISLAGQSITAMDEDARARFRAQQVGFVFQSFQLLPALTALENVMLPLELAQADRPAERARELLARVGLAERLQHTPRQLSGGEQQRVAIARAYAVDPLILFADEPTGNLDTQTGKMITDLLMQLNAEQGTTLVMVTHDERLAAQCDRRFSIAAGRLSES